MTAPPCSHLLAIEPAEVYKSDGRSRVWRVDRKPELGGQVVIKRFDYAPWRQLLGRLLGMHPAQRERRWNQRLRKAGLSVVPITARGVTAGSWRGCRLWLATPYTGLSLQQLFRRGFLHSRHRRLAILRAAADLTVDLIRHRYYFRDLKPSNILIDQQDRAWLIDVGAVRRRLRPVHVVRMLALMLRKARQDGVSRTDQLRFFSLVVNRYPQAGDRKAFIRSIDRLAIAAEQSDALAANR